MESKKKIAWAVFITFVLTSVLYTAAFTVIPSFGGMLGDIRALLDKSDNAELTLKTREINRIVDDYYIYDYDKKEMTDFALGAYVAGLDDVYSEYITKDNYAKMMEDLTGDYKGIGVEVFIDTDNLITVLSAFEDAPAHKAGIKANDKIISVNGVLVNGDNYNEAVNMMKGVGKYGKNGDDLTLTVKRGENEFEAKLTRAEVINHTVKTKMLKNKIGYVRISQFDEVTGDDFEKLTDKLLSDGAKSIIIDLRNNPGGVLTGVVQVADKLLPKGKIITVKDKTGEEIVYNSDENEIDVPMCVLINGASASASEVLAGALRDHKKAVLVGEKSYGKGVVQSVFNLSDGSAFKLTTAEYFTPNGESIHKKGITPDHVVKLEANTNVFALSESEDIQLQKAIEVLSK